MKRIALTGGIACGKSLVAKYLNEFGVETIDADDIVHELIPDPAERKRIAAEVFGNPEKRKALEAKLHPIVRGRIAEWLSAGEEHRRYVLAAGATRYRIAIIPLLFETHWDAEYDIICTVSSSRETQVERMMTTRGYTCEEAEARLNAQWPVADKAKRSNYVIVNDGSAEELREKVAAFVDWLKTK